MRSFLLFILSFAIGTGVFAWTNPTATPPNNNVALFSPWQPSGSDIFFSAGNASVGTNTALTPLTLKGPQIPVFSSATRGTLTVTGDYTAGRYMAIDFAYNPTANPTARIAAYHDGGGSRLYLGTSSNYASGITSYGLTVDPSGNVGVKMSPNGPTLHVNGAIGATQWVGAGCETGCSADAYVLLYPDGRGVATTGWQVASDARLKKNVIPLGGMFDKIEQLRAVEFEWKDPKRNQGKQIGFIAQEVEKVMPVLVSQDMTGYKNVNYGVVSVMLVEAMKEMNAKYQKQIESLEERVRELEGRK
ncbi:MAG: cell wall surface anchor family protein [Parcubacteria group bacterium Gr01-1014_18]|nr:MAG: cell wall surface anchor family protein [Parcubacteria group bacterium Greene0416_36]TSC81353.1 MAG: cell wall surface anchor family protein [Parcubacteria group bacterium Gr01-1014_18]TSC99461.1 MAG: cell wall surface anchor family protein [Parcubacteria group bacterium Greene1014_20]TSD07620.1 MAG: cell wall surface anchor family protein [Parcubacteria group bacterium Greene0714_2]